MIIIVRIHQKANRIIIQHHRYTSKFPHHPSSYSYDIDTHPVEPFAYSILLHFHVD